MAEPASARAAAATATATRSLAPVVGFFWSSVLGVSWVGLMMTMVVGPSPLQEPKPTRPVREQAQTPLPSDSESTFSRLANSIRFVSPSTTTARDAEGP